MPLYITKKNQRKTIKMLIIDDSFDDTLKLENAIIEATKASSYSIIIHTRTNADELLTIAKEYDYIFLDIVFHDSLERNGITYAKQLTSIDPSCNIIFTTHNKHFVFEACQAKPIAFLEKPIDASKIKDLFATTPYTKSDLVWKIEFGKRNDAVIFSSKIIYVEASAHKTKCTYIDENNNSTSMNCNLSLVDWSELLELNYLFKIRTSFIINFLYIKEITSEYILFFNDSKIYFPKTAYREIKNAYIHYKAFRGFLS